MDEKRKHSGKYINVDRTKNTLLCVQLIQGHI